MNFDLKSEPVDIVYTWVNGSDSNWLNKKNNELEKCKIPLTPESNKGRFEDHDELLYSLRSVDLYMPWVRNIFIVTDNQIPSWLDLTNPKIKIIDHGDIFPDYVRTPVFNSLLIEFFFHNIPDLSEKFIYFNDDFFVNKPLNKKDFFSEEGSPIYFCYKSSLSENKLDFEVPKEWFKDEIFLNKIYNYFNGRTLPHYFSQNSFEVIRLDYPEFDHFFWLKHAPYSFSKKYVEKMYKKYELYIKLMGENQFRSKTDLHLAKLVAFTEKNEGTAIFSENDYDLFEFGLGYTEQESDSIFNIWNEKYKFICIAQFEKSKDYYVKIAKAALGLRFNLASQFEKKDFFSLKNDGIDVVCNLAFQAKNSRDKIIFDLNKTISSMLLEEKGFKRTIEEKNREIDLIKSSKFWKLRSFYLKIKTFLNNNDLR